MGRAFEDNVDFTMKKVYASEYTADRMPLVNFLIYTICRIFGRISIFDYATRVNMAQQMFDNINPDHKRAAKLSIEKILINLSPTPDTVSAATAGLARLQEQSIDDAMNLIPLDDTPFQGYDIVDKRYTLLRDSLIMYCDVGLDGIRMDLKDEKLPDFHSTYNEIMAKVRKYLQQLEEIRFELFEDFDLNELAYVSDEAVIKRKTIYHIKDTLRATNRGLGMLTENEEMEHYARNALTEIIKKAKQDALVLTELERRYFSALKNVDLLKCAVAPHLDQDTTIMIEHKLHSFETEIKDCFALDNFIPKDILEDISQNRTMHRKGEFPPSRKYDRKEKTLEPKQ